MALGSKTATVNANVYKLYFGSVAAGNEYILVTRKEAVYRVPQKRVPTGAGPVYFSMLSDDRLLLEFAFTTSELGSGTSKWNSMIQRNASTGEVPENTFVLAREGVAETVFQKAAGPNDDR